MSSSPAGQRLLRGVVQPDGLQVGVVSVEDLAGAHRAEWDDLFERQRGLANPFCAPEWVEGWYHHFTRPQDRCLVTVRHLGRLVGVAPFFRDLVSVSRVPLARRLRLVGAGQGGSLLELPQVLAAPGRERPVLRAVVAATMTDDEVRQDADWAEVAVPVQHGWFEPEWAYGTQQPVAFFRPQMSRASVVLELAEDWGSTYAGLKRNVKESLRRSRNRLARDGRQWAVERRTADLDETVVERLLDLHRERARQDVGVVHRDAFSDPARRAFVRDVLPALGRRGRATVLELRLEGDVVAVQLALHGPGTTYLHSSGFVPTAWWLGAVTFLQGVVAAEAADRGDGWLNFSPGPNVAKLRWSETLDVHQDFAYGAGGRSLRWRYGVFAMGQANEQVAHAVSVSAQNTAPARVDPAGCGRGAQR
jgi:hypothetical protein